MGAGGGLWEAAVKARLRATNTNDLIVEAQLSMTLKEWRDVAHSLNTGEWRYVPSRFRNIIDAVARKADAEYVVESAVEDEA